jgi:LacI family transcriptional regulator
VLEAADALNYRPSSVARALKTSRTFAVGVAVPDLGNPVFPPVIRGLEDILSAAGYTLMLSNSDGDLLQERTVVRAMLSRQVDGVVLLTSHLRDPIVDELITSRVPLILIGRTVEDPRVSSVVSDDVAGMAMAVDHLLQLGHTRIAFIGGPQHVSTGRRRYEGYLLGHRLAGLSPVSTLVEFADSFDDLSGISACKKLIDWGEDFSAVLASGDGIAIGCLDVLRGEGFEVPEDISLVGYGGARLGLHLKPTLTTVEVPYREMGRAGAELLLARIAGNAEISNVVFQPTLRVGTSTQSAQSSAARNRLPD